MLEGNGRLPALQRLTCSVHRNRRQIPWGHSSNIQIGSIRVDVVQALRRVCRYQLIITHSRHNLSTAKSSSIFCESTSAIYMISVVLITIIA